MEIFLLNVDYVKCLTSISIAIQIENITLVVMYISAEMVAVLDNSMLWILFPKASFFNF